MPDNAYPATPICPDEFARMMSACVSASTLAFGGRVAVAVSGGADSMALCLLTHDWARTQGTGFVALTVDHGLRAGSDAEAAQVGAWLKARGVSHHILTWEGGAGCATGMQARARAARYALMRDWCLDKGVDQILAGHQLEDQAETVLMRLKKGSGLMGLAAMARVRDLEGVHLVRPLLDVSKTRLRATLRAKGQDWVEDPSNRNRAFERVRTRDLLHHLQNQGVSAERLAGAARACARVRAVLEQAAEALIVEAGIAKTGNAKTGNAKMGSGEGEMRLNAIVFLAAPQRVREVALSKLLARVGGGAYPPSPAKLERMSIWLTGRGDAARTLSGCEVRLKGRTILISPERPRKSAKGRKKAENKCATALALSGQTPYIQGNQHPQGR